MTDHPIVPLAEWLERRRELLAKEKELTRLRDRLSAERRALPWRRIEKDYVFQGSNGEKTFADLFDGRSQLVVYHFMFAPDWDAGCKSCSFWIDNLDRQVVHLAHRDVTAIAVSRAPVEKLLAYRERMGWEIEWVSSGDGDFNYDFQVSFTDEQMAGDEVIYNYAPIEPFSGDLHGISVFFKDDDGTIYHTYSTYGRGLDMMNTAYHYLDLVPKGRDEADRGMAWLRRRDEYAD